NGASSQRLAASLAAGSVRHAAVGAASRTRGIAMRPIHCLPLAAAILLAACGGGADDLAADGEVTEDELAAALDDAVRPLPGQYRTAIELIEFDIPGMPEAMKGQMRQLVAGEFAQGNEFCMTPEE